MINIPIKMKIYEKITLRDNNWKWEFDFVEQYESIQQKILKLNNEVEKWILPSSFLLENLVKENKKLLEQINNEQEKTKEQIKNTDKEEYKAVLQWTLARLDMYEKWVIETQAKLRQFLDLVSKDNNTNDNKQQEQDIIRIYDVDGDNKIDEFESQLLKEEISKMEEYKKTNKKLFKNFIKYKKPEFNNIEIRDFIDTFKQYLEFKDIEGKIKQSYKNADTKYFYYWQNDKQEIRDERHKYEEKLSKLKYLDDLLFDCQKYSKIGDKSTEKILTINLNVISKAKQQIFETGKINNDTDKIIKDYENKLNILKQIDNKIDEINNLFTDIPKQINSVEQFGTNIPW